MTELILVRHGRTVGGWWRWWQDPPLSPVGIADAEKVADRLAADARPAVLYTSPLRRADATARIIAERLCVTPVVEPAVREAGVVTAIVLSLYVASQHAAWKMGWWGGWIDDVARVVPGINPFVQRVARTIDGITARHPNVRIVIVTHAGTIRAAVAHLLTKQTSLAWLTRVECGKVVRIAIDRGTSSVIEVNG